MHYSIIIPVYNRPAEVAELLDSLTKQTYKDFEVLIIEDGSEISCKNVVQSFSDMLHVRYYHKENSGQGFSRNYGFERATGDYLVVFDSDCIIPPHYFKHVTNQLRDTKADCWGGPDRALPSFSRVQKAINYSMTSFFTTGGIRGGRKMAGTFHPRSFNMGISRKVFEETGGYKITRMGEDIEFSIRIIRSGFKTVLIEDAYVYHKRRTGLKQFYNQLHFFGRARINISRFFPDELKLVHFFPVLFFIGYLLIIPAAVISLPAGLTLLALYLIYSLLLLFDAFRKEKNIAIGFTAVISAYIQFTAYGIGFLSELMNEQSL